MEIKKFVMLHKRAIKLILMILNTLLVIILFSAAALLFYSVSDKSPTMFGCSLVLVKDDITKTATLVFADKTEKVVPNDSFLYIARDKGGSRVCTATEIAGEMLTFSVTDDAGVSHDISLSTSGEEYGGIVKGQNNFLGRLFDIFANRQNMPFIYMVIGGICALILLLLVLLYFFFKKNDVQEYMVAEVENDETDENGLIQDNFIEPVSHISVVEEELPPLIPPPLEEPEVANEKNGFGKFSSLKSGLDKTETQRSAPAPVWETPFSPKSNSTVFEENEPSIESLMEEIDLLGGEWDEDLKIYSSKKK